MTNNCFIFSLLALSIITLISPFQMPLKKQGLLVGDVKSFLCNLGSSWI